MSTFAETENNREDWYDTFDPDDPVWDLINGLPPEYRKQLESYLHFNYATTVGDRIGLSGGFDKYKGTYQDKVRQMLSSMYNDIQQNAYNAAQSQASRERDAGLNPDLAGETSGEEAATTEQPLQPVDPSVFQTPTDVMTNLVDVFGLASSGLQSVSTFSKLLADRQVAKANVGQVQSLTAAHNISSLQAAFDLAGEWLSGFDPATRLNFDDVIPSSGSDDEKRFALEAAITSAFHSDFNHLDDSSKEFLNRAFTARIKDPRVMDDYYKSYSDAASHRVVKLASQQAYGSLSTADDLIATQNKIILDHAISSIRSQIELNAVSNAYNVQRLKNDFDYEQFKAQYKIPQQIAEADLQSYLNLQAKAKADAAAAAAKKAWLDHLLGLKEQNDPGAIYLLNGFLNPAGYSGVNSYGGKISGPFGIGFNGNWTRPILPGIESDPTKFNPAENVPNDYISSHTFN